MARKAKVTESTSTVESQDDGQPVEFEGGASGLPPIELVDDPGPVKKIRFDGQPPQRGAPPADAEAGRPEMQFRRAVASDRPEGAGERSNPASARVVREHTESIYSIREEVDHLGRPDPKFRGAPARSNLRSWKAETLYRTDRGGEVRAYDGPSGRTFALSDGASERRFTEADVDRVIAGIRLGETSRQERGESRADSEADAEAAPEAASPAARSSSSRLLGFMGRRSRRKAGEAEAITGEDDGEAEAKEYQPQCSAVTEEGLQCRNSARSGSKYCSSHFGFQPRTAQGLHQARDTEPRYASSRDTLPGGAGWDPSQQGGHQCGALTRDGKQCMNPVMADSPYCGSHQEYEEPTPREIVAASDTKPRWAKAKDTKPATRRSARPAKAAKKGRRKA